ncbi:hypothetical protein Oscil6304_3640 [Oscillatoria acuminata PCC 6304]|uniref:Uncharacterized protein n=1 Tax=Oscillatoria acuminata PCC 6304 TaxID=56110 RepID=K9TLB4_9CYAN|nr:hypothetical protein Oscil6304_3640 [Oscillatoria acuminata PCC 6304]
MDQRSSPVNVGAQCAGPWGLRIAPLHIPSLNISPISIGGLPHLDWRSPPSRLAVSPISPLQDLVIDKIDDPGINLSRHLIE